MINYTPHLTAKITKSKGISHIPKQNINNIITAQLVYYLIPHYLLSRQNREDRNQVYKK